MRADRAYTTADNIRVEPLGPFLKITQETEFSSFRSLLNQEQQIREVHRFEQVECWFLFRC